MTEKCALPKFSEQCAFVKEVQKNHRKSKHASELFIQA